MISAVLLPTFNYDRDILTYPPDHDLGDNLECYVGADYGCQQYGNMRVPQRSAGGV
jgi:hypothetical protein